MSRPSSNTRFSEAARRAHSSVSGLPGRNSAGASGISQIPRPSAIPDRPKSKGTAHIVNLIEFLTKTNYDGQISFKALQSPSQRMVFSIFKHIMSHFVPNLSVPQEKVALEDHFINTFKLFGYPVALKRSTVTTPGAPHSASQILAALDWLRAEFSAAAAKENDIYYAEDKEGIPVGKLVFGLLLKCMEANTATPPEGAREQFELECAKSLGCRSEDVAELKVQLAELMKKPSLTNIMQEERDLRSRLASVEREIAEQNDHLQHLKNRIPEAEAKASTAVSNVEEIRSQVGEVAAEVEKLENLVAIQRAQYGDIVNTYQKLQEHYKSRCAVRDDLAKRLDEQSIELGRMDKPVAPALDEYNSLAVRLTDPSLPQLKMRSYLHTFDPLKEIPIICSELAEVHSKLTVLAEKSQAEATGKCNELDALESDCAKKMEDLAKVEQDLSEREKQKEDSQRQASLRKAAFNRWLAETDVAIAEARQSAVARKQYLEKLQTEIEQNKKNYEYYGDLNRKMRAFSENYEREVMELLRSLKLAVTLLGFIKRELLVRMQEKNAAGVIIILTKTQADILKEDKRVPTLLFEEMEQKRLEVKAERRKAEETTFLESMTELESKSSQLINRTEALLKDARSLADRSAAYCKE